MKRANLNVLFVGDNDLLCKKKDEERTIEDINIAKVGFVASDLEVYDMIIYDGRLGKKILKIK